MAVNFRCVVLLCFGQCFGSQLTSKMYEKSLHLTVLVVLLGVTSECLDRKVVSVLNPHCPSAYGCNSSVAHLYYVRADSENDSLHYFWSFSGKPTMTLALTSLDTQASISWPTFANQSFNSNGTIQLNKSPMYVFGVVMNRLFEFNDVSDSGTFNISNHNSSYVRDVPMPSNWTVVNVMSANNSSKLSLLGTWSSADEGMKSGRLELNVVAYGVTSHGERLPHMLQSGNSTEMEMVLRDVETTSGFQSRRFGMELLVTASEETSANWTVNSFKGLDDENTPGIFTLTELQSPASVNQSAGGFLQWRPVSYIADVRDITNSTEMFVYSVHNVSSEEFNNTLLPAFSQLNLNSYLTQSCIVSFGATGDGFFSKYNYTSWTVTMGYGKPPFEQFSLLVILVIGFCLGVPTALIVGSGCYLCIRSLTRRKDDLLLES